MLQKILTLSILVISSLTHSQNHVDALRYSLFNNYNTAGISALGGAGGLLSHNHNPASLAFFSSGQVFSLSIANDNASIETNYLNDINITEKPYDIAPYIQNVGYVTNLPIQTENEWSKFNLAISSNRKQNFNQNIVMEGYNELSSMSNMFLQSAQGSYPDDLNPFSDYLAWYTYLIDTIAENGITDSYISNINSNGQSQNMTINQGGYINEFDLAFSTAYNDFLFLGISMGITEIQFHQHISFNEDNYSTSAINSSNPDDILHLVDNFEYNQHLYVEGEGINFKFGTFIKPTSFLRLGWAYHSKTYTSLEEVYETSMETNFMGGDQFEAFSPINIFNYEINTPAKSISTIGLTTKYNQLRMLLTIDYEIIDYGSSKLHSTFYRFDEENEDISNFYERTNNTKIGIAIMTEKISLKGGYSIFGSPYKANLNDGEKEYISGGIGFKSGKYSFDISIIHSKQNEDYILYQDLTLSNPDQISNNSYERNTIIGTCTYKF